MSAPTPPTTRTPRSKRDRMLAAIDAARSARDALADALADVDAIRQEYEEWHDNMPEGLQNSERGEAVGTVADTDTDPDTLLQEVDTALDELAASVEAVP